MRSASAGVDVGLAHAAGAAARPCWRRALDRHAEVGEQLEHRLRVADPRDVVQDDLLLGEQAQASSGSAAFLFPAGTTVPDSGTPPSMTNFSMGSGGLG